MRNYASAAHPNQVRLTGLQLASWLETCVLQVITLPYDTITAETGKLLRNIKTDRLDPADARGATAFFDDLPRDRADKLGAGLFGLYVDAGRTPLVADNVRLLWPELWPYVSEDARYGFGVKYGRFRASADTAQAHAARELLDLVGGLAYIPEKDRAVEIDAAIDALLAAHHGWNNFHAEAAPARDLAALVGERADIPAAVEKKYLTALVEVFLGNAYGVSWAAEPTYLELLEKLGSSQAGLALRTFAEPTISNKLWTEIGQRQWTKLLGVLEPKLTRPVDRELMDAVNAFPGTPDQLRLDSSINQVLKRARA